MIDFPNAKINIGLNIIEKRDDGFHNIESVFYPINTLCDVLEIVENKDKKAVEFQSTGIEIPKNDEHNLCVRAFFFLRKDFKIPFVKIHLHKTIPIGAGLGGGSADAAFTLKILNNLFCLKLSNQALINYAKKLGSDCAFFIENKPVYATQKGDVFKNIKLDLSNYKIKIVYPNTHISTAEAYETVIPKKANTCLYNLIDKPILNWKSAVKNDFELPIFKHHPKIKEAKQKMYKNGAIYASMTGSGSAVYGIFES